MNKTDSSIRVSVTIDINVALWSGNSRFPAQLISKVLSIIIGDISDSCLIDSVSLFSNLPILSLPLSNNPCLKSSDTKYTLCGLGFLL